MNFLYRIYFWLPNFGVLGHWGKAINVLMAMLLKRIFDNTVPAYYRKTAITAPIGINTSADRSTKYIVSITSFPGRIEQVWISIETILRQSFKPDAVILWLAHHQFPDKQIPDNLKPLLARGLTIKFCEDDIRSHKKYFYSLLEFPYHHIITVDDDMYYHKDVLKNLVNMQALYPGEICANKVHEIGIENSDLKPYRKWKHNAKGILTPSHKLLQVGGGGVLYSAGSLDKRVLDQETFRHLCFHADDLWLKVMGFLNDSKVVTNSKYNKEFITVSKTQREKLVNTNVFSGGNDLQLKKLMNYFNINAVDFLKD